MGGIFDIDGTLLRGLTKIADIMILNIIFLITCIPILTIGTAITSLYEVTLKMAKNEEAYIIKSYFKAFKSNFKKSTIVWIGCAFMFVVLIVDLHVAGQQEGQIWSYIYTSFLAFSIVFWWYFGMLFPIMAKFENTIKRTLINTGYVMVRHMMTSFSVMVLNSVLFILILWNAYTMVYGLLAYLVFGFAAIAYMNSTFLVRVYEKYYNKKEVE